MKNNKGFTIIEVMAVVLIMGILASIATISVTRYRSQVDEKEIVTLKSTISTGYDNYRQKQLLNGDSALSKKYFCDGDVMFMDISYSGKKLTCDDIKAESFVELEIKGDLLDVPEYTAVRRNPDDFISDGTCLIETKIENNKFVKSCKEGIASPEPSKEELLCIYLETNDKVIIDDFNDENSLCKFFGR